MTTKTTQKNEGMIAFLASVLKKSAELPEDLSLISSSIKAVAEEVKYLTKAVAMLATAVQRHNDAISDLYATQDYILNQVRPSSKIDTNLPSINKDKSEKPN